MTDLTHTRLLEVLHYDPKTGAFTWRAKVSRKVLVGGLAGTTQSDKITIGLFGKTYAAHRLAWFYMTGTWPPSLVDHRDLNGHNNKWRNLRLATKSTNGQNRGAQRNNTTGLKGVCHRKDGRYTAQIKHAGKNYYLGLYDTPEDAHIAYSAAARKFHKQYARTT